MINLVKGFCMLKFNKNDILTMLNNNKEFLLKFKNNKYSNTVSK